MPGEFDSMKAVLLQLRDYAIRKKSEWLLSMKKKAQPKNIKKDKETK